MTLVRATALLGSHFGSARLRAQGVRSCMPRWSAPPLALCGALFLSSHAALADLAQQGSKLVGTGAGPGSASQGSSVSVSADGNTALVGGDNDNNAAGAVWVFTRSGGVWTQQGSK